MTTWDLTKMCTCGLTNHLCQRHIYKSEKPKRKLNPRICRGCGKVFMPKTALQRYGNQECKKLGQNYHCRAMPGGEINHG